MNFRILKKDLKRKKSINIILLIFIALATTFIASSVTNMSVILNATDDFFEAAELSDHIIITKRELPHIFDSFYRGSNVEKENGSGLGLYICKKLMHLMEGEITGRIIECESGNKMQVNILFRM